MKTSRLKIIVITIVVQIFVIYVIYKNVVKPPVPIKDEKSDYSCNANQFYIEFMESNAIFDEKYLNKVIDLTGVVTSVYDSVIVLNNKVLCVSNLRFTDAIKGESLKVKGKYIGYDELFDNLKMSECLIESL